MKKKKTAKIYCLGVTLLLMDINMKNDSEREIGVGSLNVSKPLGAGRVNGGRFKGNKVASIRLKVH